MLSVQSITSQIAPPANKENEETLAKLIEILKPETLSSNLPSYHIEYMANIIIESPPRNSDDLVCMIGDFLDNNPFITEQQIKQKCDSIH